MERFLCHVTLDSEIYTYNMCNSLLSGNNFVKLRIFDFLVFVSLPLLRGISDIFLYSEDLQENHIVIEYIFTLEQNTKYFHTLKRKSPQILENATVK